MPASDAHTYYYMLTHVPAPLQAGAGQTLHLDLQNCNETTMPVGAEA